MHSRLWHVLLCSCFSVHVVFSLLGAFCLLAFLLIGLGVCAGWLSITLRRRPLQRALSYVLLQCRNHGSAPIVVSDEISALQQHPEGSADCLLHPEGSADCLLTACWAALRQEAPTFEVEVFWATGHGLKTRRARLGGHWFWEKAEVEGNVYGLLSEWDVFVNGYNSVSMPLFRMWLFSWLSKCVWWSF